MLICDINTVDFIYKLRFQYGSHISVTDSLFLSQTERVCHRQLVSVTKSMCLSLTIFVCIKPSS